MSAPMRRREISKQDIESVIVSLYGRGQRRGDRFPTVRDVARELRARHGSCGTNDRICVALQNIRCSSGLSSGVASTGTSNEWQLRARELAEGLDQLNAAHDQQVSHLSAQLEAAIARAERAEARERAHQDRWAVENYELKLQLKTVDAKRPRGVDPDVHLKVHRELAAATAELARVREILDATAPRALCTQD